MNPYQKSIYLKMLEKGHSMVEDEDCLILLQDGKPAAYIGDELSCIWAAVEFYGSDLFKELNPLLKETRAFQQAMENSQPIQGETSSEYRTLSVFGNTVLAGKLSAEDGYYCAVWDNHSENDSDSKNDRYYSNSFQAACEDFAVHSGMISADKVITQQDASLLLKALNELELGEYKNLSEEESNQMDSLVARISSVFPTASFSINAPEFPPVYPHFYEEAERLQELDLWKESDKRNRTCADFIEQGISEKFDGYRVPKDVIPQACEQFGYERTRRVIADSLLRKNHDGRISSENKKWALTYGILEDLSHYGYNKLDDNPGITGILANQVKKLEPEPQMEEAEPEVEMEMEI